MLPGEQTPVGRRQGCATTAQEPRLARGARSEAMHGWRVFRTASASRLGQRGSQWGQTRAGAVRTMCGPAAQRWDGKVRHCSLGGPCAPEVPWSRMHGFAPETSRSSVSCQHVHPVRSENVEHFSSMYSILSHKGYVTHQELTRVKSRPYLLHRCVAQSHIARPAYRSATSLRLASVSPSM